MVTVYDVARHVGLSIASVSRALNGQPGVSSATVARVMAAAEELDYHRSDIAKALVTKSTGAIGILVPDLTNPFFPELVHGMQEAADRAGLTLLLGGISASASASRVTIGMLRRKKVDGIIVVAGALDLEGQQDLFTGVPAVFLDRPLSLEGVGSVGIDHEDGAYQATRHLIDLGHRRIAHISGPRAHDVAIRRLAGWRRACEEAGIPAEDLVLADGDFSESGGYLGAEQVLADRDRVTAIFAANDLSAIGVLSYCADHGISVPDDLSVIGFDGIALCRYVTPKLSTVAQPIAQLGAAAIDSLQVAITEGRPESIVLRAELRPADSTAAPREGSDR